MMLGVVPFLSGFLVLCECRELSAYCQQIPLLLLFVKVGFCKLQSKKSWQIHLRASYLNLSHSLLLHFSNGRNNAYLTGWGMGEMRWHGNELGTVPPTWETHKMIVTITMNAFYSLCWQAPCLGVIPFQAPPRSHSSFRGNLAARRFIKKRQTQK